MPSTSFSNGLKTFFKSVKDGTKEMTFTEKSPSLVKEQRILPASTSTTSSDVYILLNSNQCNFNIGNGESSFFKSNIKTESANDIVILDSDSDSELSEVKIEISTPMEKKKNPGNELLEKLSLSTDSVSVCKEKTFSYDSESTTQRLEEKSLVCSVPAHQGNLSPLEDINIVKEESEETSICKSCSKPISILSGTGNDFCCCFSYSSSDSVQGKSVNYQGDFDYVLGSSNNVKRCPENVPDCSETFSNFQNSWNENSHQICVYCKKEYRGDLQFHLKFSCTAIEITSRLLCNICNGSFSGPLALVKHVEEVHSSKVNFQDALQSENNEVCKKLDVSSESNQITRKSLRKKTAKHLEISPQSDETCSIKNKKKICISKLEMPVSNLFAETKSRKSKISTRFDSAKVLALSLSAGGRSKICPFCKRIQRTNKELLIHCEFYCSATKTFKLVCKLCSEHLSGPNSLIQHFHSKHKTKMSYIEAYSAKRVNDYDKKLGNISNIANTKKKSMRFKESSKSLKQSIPLNSEIPKNTCSFCTVTFGNKSKLEEHSNFNCPSGKRLKLLCRICSNGYSGRASLRNHTIQVHKITANSTMLHLAKNVKSSSDIRIQIKGKTKKSGATIIPQKSKKSLYCSYCKKTFSTKSNLNAHYNFHCPSGKKLNVVCRICSNVYSSPNSLRLHMLRFHKISKIKSQFSSEKKVKSTYISNESNKHQTKGKAKSSGGNSAKSPSCLYCKKTFSNRGHLQEHCSYHCPCRKSMKFFCRICSIAFSSPRSLRVHMLAFHKISTDVKSQFSSAKQVKSSDILDDSNKQTKGNTKSNGNNLDISKKSKESLCCSDCKKTFHHDDAFQRHTKFHCPNRETYKLICSICSNYYAGPHALRNHMRNVHNKSVSYFKAKRARKVKSSEVSEKQINVFEMEDSEEKSDISESCKPSEELHSYSSNSFRPFDTRREASNKHSQISEVTVNDRNHVNKLNKNDILKQKVATSQAKNKCRSLKAKNSVRNLRATKLLKFFEQSGFKMSSSSCPICGKYVYSLNVLKIHMRKHTNEKPFHCRKCGRRFVSKLAVKYHAITKCPKRNITSKTIESCHNSIPATSKEVPVRNSRRRSCNKNSRNTATDENGEGEMSNNTEENCTKSAAQFPESSVIPSKVFTNLANNVDDIKRSTENNLCEGNTSDQSETISSLSVEKKTKCVHCDKLIGNRGYFMHERYCKSKNNEKDSQEEIADSSRNANNSDNDNEEEVTFNCNACTNKFSTIHLLIQHLQEHLTTME